MWSFSRDRNTATQILFTANPGATTEFSPATAYTLGLSVTKNTPEWSNCANGCPGRFIGSPPSVRIFLHIEPEARLELVDELLELLDFVSKSKSVDQRLSSQFPVLNSAQCSNWRITGFTRSIPFGPQATIADSRVKPVGRTGLSESSPRTAKCRPCLLPREMAPSGMDIETPTSGTTRRAPWSSTTALTMNPSSWLLSSSPGLSSSSWSSSSSLLLSWFAWQVEPKDQILPGPFTICFSIVVFELMVLVSYEMIGLPRYQISLCHAGSSYRRTWRRKN